MPVTASAGTTVVIEVAVLAVTTATTFVGEPSVPSLYTLNRTVLLDGVVLKLVPVMMTVVPTGPDGGENEVIVGAAVVVTVKSAILVAVLHPTRTLIFPVVALDGTVAEILDVVPLAETTAVEPLNLTVLLEVGVPKFAPSIFTTVPTTPEVGVNEVMEGAKPVLIFWIKISVLPPEVRLAVVHVGSKSAV